MFVKGLRRLPGLHCTTLHIMCSMSSLKDSPIFTSVALPEAPPKINKVVSNNQRVNVNTYNINGSDQKLLSDIRGNETFTFVGDLSPHKQASRSIQLVLNLAHKRSFGQDSEICRIKPVAECHPLKGIRPRDVVDWLVEILPKF